MINNSGVKSLGKFFNSRVYINWNNILRYNGEKRLNTNNDKVLGKLLIVFGVILLVLPVILLFLGGDLHLAGLVSPTNILEFLIYTSIYPFLYGRFLLRDRNEFDDDLNKYFDLNKLHEGNKDIWLDKYLDIESLYILDEVSLKHNENVLIHLIYLLLNSSRGVYLLESRLGVSVLNINQNLNKYIQNSNIGALDEFLFKALILSYETYSHRIDTQTLVMVAIKFYLKEMLLDYGITDLDIKNLEVWVKNDNRENQYQLTWERLSKLKPVGAINRGYTSKATPFLDTISSDLTKESSSLEHFKISLGREKEIGQVFQILQRDSGTSAVLLVGEPGVGKTAFIKYLANRMVLEDVPESLEDSRLVSIEVGKFLTQSSSIDDFKRGIDRALGEADRSGKIVLVLEEFSQLLTIRDDTRFEVINLLLNAISNLKLKIIATTTPDDLNKYIKPMKTLISHFDIVEMLEPDSGASFQILVDEVKSLESRFDLSVQISAIKTIVEFSPRFNHDRAMPDKGLDLLEEACLKARSEGSKYVDNRIVEGIIKDKIGVNLGSVSTEESTTLQNLEDNLSERIIGQAEAVRSIALAIRRSRSGLSNTKKPIASFLFYGATGVGKTELARALTDIYYGDARLITRIDMSEYQEASNLSRLIGIVDSKGNFEGGFLTEAIRVRPFSLILLDEIEKANPKVLDLFLQVMDDGILTDGLGRKIDFSNTIIIMTTNIGSKEIVKLSELGQKYNDIQKESTNVLREYFRIEFLNRFDKIIMFRTLSLYDIEQIVEIELSKIKKNLEERGITFRWESSILKELAKKSYSKSYGAREVRRVIQDSVEDKIASKIIDGTLRGGGEFFLEKI